VFADTPTVLSPLIQAWRSDEKTKMVYDAEMQWLEAKQGAKDSAFVSTTFDLENGETEKTVEFEQAFPKGSEIQVVGWVQSFRFGTEEGKDYACDFWATKVNAKGFTAHAECGENTERLTVTYIALKKGKDKVATGSFSTTNDGEEGENAQEIKGKVNFAEGAFDKAPTVLVALSQFELAGGKDLRVGVEVEAVSESGFSWTIRKWHCALLYLPSADIDQVHGETMQRAHCRVQKLPTLPLGIDRVELDSFIVSILFCMIERKLSVSNMVHQKSNRMIAASACLRAEHVLNCDLNVLPQQNTCSFAMSPIGSKWERAVEDVHNIAISVSL